MFLIVLNVPNVKYFELHSVYERCYTNKVYYYYYYYYYLPMLYVLDVVCASGT